MLIFIDVETTGTTVKDVICSCGVLLKNGSNIEAHYELLNPSCKIKKGAMAVHHITNEMVKSALPFKSSHCFEILNEHNSAANTLIAFESEFVHSMLQKEGVVWQGETVNLKHCIQTEIEGLESYALQFLRYELGLYKKEQEYKQYFNEGFIPHHAMGDTLLSFALYNYLLESYTLDVLITLSNTPVLISTVGFGKYKRRALADAVKEDPDYFLWLREQVDLDEDLRYSINYYLKGRV